MLCAGQNTIFGASNSSFSTGCATAASSPEGSTTATRSTPLNETVPNRPNPAPKSSPPHPIEFKAARRAGTVPPTFCTAPRPGARQSCWSGANRFDHRPIGIPLAVDRAKVRAKKHARVVRSENRPSRPVFPRQHDSTPRTINSQVTSNRVPKKLRRTRKWGLVDELGVNNLTPRAAVFGRSAKPTGRCPWA